MDCNNYLLGLRLVQYRQLPLNIMYRLAAEAVGALEAAEEEAVADVQIQRLLYLKVLLIQ